jgi:hypothetical protein
MLFIFYPLLFLLVSEIWSQLQKHFLNGIDSFNWRNWAYSLCLAPVAKARFNSRTVSKWATCRVARICTVNGYICICWAFKIPISQSLCNCLQIPPTNSEAQQISFFHLCKHQVHVAINKAGIQIPCYLLEVPVAHSRIHHVMLDNDGNIHQ